VPFWVIVRLDDLHAQTNPIRDNKHNPTAAD
jgi:hypothetical protein